MYFTNIFENACPQKTSMLTSRCNTFVIIHFFFNLKDESLLFSNPLKSLDNKRNHSEKMAIKNLQLKRYENESNGWTTLKGHGHDCGKQNTLR